MKKFKAICAVLFIITGTATAYGQESSQLNALTFGLFRTELDAAFDPVTLLPGPVFGEIGGEMFFSGLTNFPDLSSRPGVYTTSPLTLGFYSEEGENPFGFITEFNVTSTPSTNKNGITIIGTTQNNVAGDTADWVNESTETNARLNAWDISLAPYFITGDGKTNFAVRLDAEYKENSAGAAVNTWSSNNSTVATTYFFETTGGLTPAPQSNYTRTKTNAAADTALTLDLAVPVFIPLEEQSGILIRPLVSFDMYDKSTSVTETLTAPQNTAAGNIINVTVEDKTTDVYSLLGGGAAVRHFSKGLGDHSDNLLILDGSFYIYYGLPGIYSESNIQVDYTYAGSGAAAVVSNSDTWTSTSTEREGEISGSASIGASNSFYFALAPFTAAAFKPGLTLNAGLAAGNTGSYHPKTQSVVTKFDTSGDGTINDADDTVNTVVTTYTNNGDGGAITTGLTFELPSAVVFTPAGGPVSIYAAANPRAVFSLSITSDTSTTQNVHTVTTVAGTETVNDTATGAPGLTQLTILPGFSFDFNTGAGLRFMFSDSGSIDFSVNSNTTGTIFTVKAAFLLP